MKSKHIAFCLDQAYGNLIPTFGISLELINRGHKVSYTVTLPFSPVIRKLGAIPFVIEPMDIRGSVISAVTIANDCHRYAEEQFGYYKELVKKRTSSLLVQLEELYRSNRPDLIVHDDSLDTAGRDLASKWGLARIRHLSQYIDRLYDENFLDDFEQDRLVLMTVPEFFQQDCTPLDERFNFVGFIPEGRSEVFEPWKPARESSRPILISATTGLLPQRDFYRIMIEAVRDQPWEVVLSMSGSRDRISAIDPKEMSSLPTNIQLNSSASNFDIVKTSALYVGQGGQGGVLEAIYWGVPQIVIPPQPYHYSVGRRVSELQLGRCLDPADLSVETVRAQISALLEDKDILRRVTNAGISMRERNGAQRAADIIEGHLKAHALG